MIWMNSFDLGFLGLLCCLIGAGFLFRNRTPVRFAVVGILFCVCFGSAMLLSMGPPRSLFDTARPHAGEPREEFYQGVREGSEHSQLLAPYLMLSSVGLALMAAVGQGRGRKIAEQANCQGNAGKRRI
jgi:hypothetical protein